MIPEKHVETVRQLAYEDGVEAATEGQGRHVSEWMQGTIFYDDWCDGYDSVAQP